MSTDFWIGLASGIIGCNIGWFVGLVVGRKMGYV
jgi:hypothetical protein